MGEHANCAQCGAELYVQPPTRTDPRRTWRHVRNGGLRCYPETGALSPKALPDPNKDDSKPELEREP